MASLSGAASLLLWSAYERDFSHLRGQLIATLLGFALGSVLGLIDFAAMPNRRLAARGALGCLVSSQIAWLLIVWTDAKKDPDTYRVWWIFMVASITSSHLLALAQPTTAPRGRWDVWTPRGVAVSGALLAILAFWKSLPAKPPIAYWIVLAPIVGLSIVGSCILWSRRRPRTENRPVPLPRWAKVAWVVASQAAVFMAGYYVAGNSSRAAGAFESLPSALVGLSPEQLDLQLRDDLTRLRSVATAMDELAAKSDALRKEVNDKRRAENRTFYRPEEEDRIRWHFVTYLSHRAALLRIAATYGNFEAVGDPDRRARCFTLGYAAAGITYEAALALIASYADEAAARRKLNEEERAWGLPAGVFDRILASVMHRDNSRMYAEMGAFYGEKRMAWHAAGVWPEADFGWIDARILRSGQYVADHGPSRSRHWIKTLAQRVKSDVYSPVYAAQTMLSTMIGDLRIVQDAPKIPVDVVQRDVRPKLRPGDVFLERRNWFLSNAFLPGFWPHAALYIGTPEDLKRLGIADHPEVKRRWAEYIEAGHDGHPHTVLESVSEGVVFNSAEESMHADFVAVLRPRLSETQIAQAIVRAFSHQGKPYDFEFDFFTSDKLVCTELIYRSYEGLIHFDLERIMGRDTLPALSIGRKVARERATAGRELDFVLFVDGTDGLADENRFVESLSRDGAFNE